MSANTHAGELWRAAIEWSAWGIAIVWCVRVHELLTGMPTIADLSTTDWDLGPATESTLIVVVPAKDEAENIAATCEALLMADFPRLQILCIDDRSTDGTGAILEEFAAKSEGKLKIIHLTELAEGWLGKTFALMVATENSTSNWLLFTDADILFSPSILRRAMAYAEASECDHLVVMPTPLIKSRGEGIVLGFFQVLGMWASRPWRVPDANAMRDFAGVGAFNMIRRDALEELGGWTPQRLAVLEDITLGRRVKAAGLRQRVAFAPGMVLVHWAKGARGLVRVMVKNLFSAFNFQPLLLLGAVAWICVFCLAPVAGLFWFRTLLPSLLIFCCVAAAYRTLAPKSGIDARYGWLYPLGALAFIVAMLRSMVTVWWDRGVIWRGTHYALRDLRQHNNPFTWQRAASNVRDEQMEAARMVRRAKRKT